MIKLCSYPQLIKIINRFGKGTRSTSSSASPSKTTTISYITDVEGDVSYLSRYINLSNILKFNSTNEIDFQFSLDQHNHHFVFGGDVNDKGGADVSVLKTLLNFKERYPDNVHFIMGNRDVNKMRLYPEILIEKHPGVFWKEFHDIPFNKINRLQWLLQRTMGCPDTFELRRQELSLKNDEDVLESFLELCHPQHGLIAEYLSYAKVILQIDSVLFLHGALPITTQSNMQFDHSWYDWKFAMPWIDTNEDVDFGTFCTKINQFAQKEIQEWRESAKAESVIKYIWAKDGGYNNITASNSGGALIQYAFARTPNQSKNPTVIYNSWHESNTYKNLFDPCYRAFLQSFFYFNENVEVICTGHQPQGDLPMCIQLNNAQQKHNGTNSSNWIIQADTSYSGDVSYIIENNEKIDLPHCYGRGNSNSGRGDKAVSAVEFEIIDSKLSNVSHYGYLSNGKYYHSGNLLSPVQHEHALVGLPVSKELLNETKLSISFPHLKDSWWVRTRLEDDTLLISAKDGFNVYNYELKY